MICFEFSVRDIALVAHEAIVHGLLAKAQEGPVNALAVIPADRPDGDLGAVLQGLRDGEFLGRGVFLLFQTISLRGCGAPPTPAESST